MNETIIKALGEADELADIRANSIPQPNYDICLTLYERNPDGTDAEEAFLEFGCRPQMWAVDEHMKYQMFLAMKSFENENGMFLCCYLIHLYWDGSRDEMSARNLILEGDLPLGYGKWEPTAPSDPIREDDFLPDGYSDHPTGFWNEGREPLFDNFEREPYEALDLD